MKNTSASEVFELFETSFQDKVIIPLDLECAWLKKAVGMYNLEIGDISYDTNAMEFSETLETKVIITLAMYMKKFYQEREVSKVNKRASIVTKDVSWDGSNGTKTGERCHLEYVRDELGAVVNDQKTPAYV